MTYTHWTIGLVEPKQDNFSCDWMTDDYIDKVKIDGTDTKR